MRFYLDLPLVVGYVLMATGACLGMLQYAAARGGYRGLSLFVADPKQGRPIGVGLTAGAVVAYVLFAPEILTPGPAGSEVAAMFAGCALLALTVTLLGANLRLRRASSPDSRADEPILLGDVLGALFRPLPLPTDPQESAKGHAPAVALMPDPSGFVVAPSAIVEALLEAGITVMVLDARDIAKSGAPMSRLTLLGHASTALVQLAQQPGIDADRIGLLGLGLGGDATLCAAANDTQIKAAVAISPYVSASITPGAMDAGLDWLRELSYCKAWSWRRRWPAIQRAVAEFSVMKQAEKALAAAQDSTGKNGRVITMRSAARVVSQLAIPGERCFSLLEDERACRLVAQWFQENL
jgi:hypothetical protein